MRLIFLLAIVLVVFAEDVEGFGPGVCKTKPKGCADAGWKGAAGWMTSVGNTKLSAPAPQCGSGATASAKYKVCKDKSDMQFACTDSNVAAAIKKDPKKMLDCKGAIGVLCAGFYKMAVGSTTEQREEWERERREERRRELGDADEDSAYLGESSKTASRNHDHDHKWYPGKIARRNADGTYAIHYDDGDKESHVDATKIRVKQKREQKVAKAQQKAAKRQQKVVTKAAASKPIPARKAKKAVAKAAKKVEKLKKSNASPQKVAKAQQKVVKKLKIARKAARNVKKLKIKAALPPARRRRSTPPKAPSPPAGPQQCGRGCAQVTPPECCASNCANSYDKWPFVKKVKKRPTNKCNKDNSVCHCALGMSRCGMKLDGKKWVYDMQSTKACKGLIFKAGKGAWDKVRMRTDQLTKCSSHGSSFTGEKLNQCNLNGYKTMLGRLFLAGFVGCRVQYLLKPIEAGMKRFKIMGKAVLKKYVKKPWKTIMAKVKKHSLNTVTIKCSDAPIDFNGPLITGGSYFQDSKGNTFVPEIKLSNVMTASGGCPKCSGKTQLEKLKVSNKATNVCCDGKKGANCEAFATQASSCVAAIAADVYGQIKDVVFLLDMVRCILRSVGGLKARMKAKLMAVGKKAKEKADKVKKKAKEKAKKMKQKAGAALKAVGNLFGGRRRAKKKGKRRGKKKKGGWRRV